MSMISLSALLESLLSPIFLVLAGLYFHPEDPLFLHASFPWAWLIPLLIALRYGLINAGLAIGVYLIMMYYTVHHHFYDWSSYQIWGLGGLCLVIIGGEYHGYWHRKQHKLKLKNEYLDTRLESLSRAYSSMRISHDRLEHALIMKPITLRGVLTELRYYVSRNHGQLDYTSAQELMAILANCAYVEKANLYLMENKRINTKPIASIGPEKMLLEKDVLVMQCLSKRETIYYAINSLPENEQSDYLAVIPMESADGQLYGLLTIAEIPFRSMTEESLKIMSLLLAYIADDLYAAKQGQVITKRYPDCPSFFASELFKLMHLYKIAKIDSMLFTYSFHNDSLGRDLRRSIRQETRGLDVIWERDFEEKLQLLILMPLTSAYGINPYVERIDTILLKTHSISLNDGVVQYEFRPLSSYMNETMLMEGFQVNEIS